MSAAVAGGHVGEVCRYAAILTSSGTIWSDIFVAAILGWLAFTGALQIISLARKELNNS